MRDDDQTSTGNLRHPIASASAAGTPYLTALAAIVFFSAVGDRLGFDLAALLLGGGAAAALALLALTDRIYIYPRRIVRSGYLPRFAANFTGRSLRLRIRHIEQIETIRSRHFRRGPAIFYAYRMIVRGRGAEFVLRSHSRNFRRVIEAVSFSVSTDVMDNLTLELRDYFADRRAVRAKARDADIPRGDVLEAALLDSRRGTSRLSTEIPGQLESAADRRARFEYLRRLANELRIAGFLVQALEAFRRAALLEPKNGWLLFEFSRCILSFAAVEQNTSIERRGLAMLRLAEQRSKADAYLFSRVGEAYFDVGDAKRAATVFRRGVDNFGETFRSLRGLAEIAIGEGKFAHVIHNFSAANRLATDSSLKRWTAAETDYFTRLNEDDEYLELEISRLGLIDKLRKFERSSVAVACGGIALIIAGAFVGRASIADTGWIVSALGVLTKLISSSARAVLALRIPPDTVSK